MRNHIDLAKLRKQREILNHVMSDQAENRYKSSLKSIVRLLDKIELDLEIGSECILELDRDRLQAIKDRDDFLAFYNQIDTI